MVFWRYFDVEVIGPLRLFVLAHDLFAVSSPSLPFILRPPMFHGVRTVAHRRRGQAVLVHAEGRTSGVFLDRVVRDGPGVYRGGRVDGTVGRRARVVRVFGGWPRANERSSVRMNGTGGFRPSLRLVDEDLDRPGSRIGLRNSDALEADSPTEEGQTMGEGVARRKKATVLDGRGRGEEDGRGAGDWFGEA